MNFLHRYAFDIIPAAFVAAILLYIVSGSAKPDDSCPPMYKMRTAEMVKQDGLVICKYRP